MANEQRSQRPRPRPQTEAQKKLATRAEQAQIQARRRPPKPQDGKREENALRDDISAAVKELKEKDLPNFGVSVKTPSTALETITSTQAFVPYKSVTSKGTVVTKDNHCLRIIELTPINFMVMDNREQEDIIYAFAPLFKTGPSKMRFKTIVMPANKDGYIDSIRNQMDEEESEELKRVMQSHIEMCEDISDVALERRFFLIFEYEKQGRSLKAPTLTDIELSLDRTESYIGSMLRACGNDIVVQNRLIDGYNRQLAAIEILYTFYNKNTAMNNTILEHAGRIAKDYMTAYGMDFENDPMPDIPVTAYVAPRGIDFTHKDCVIMDGRYYTFLYVTSRGYPTTTMAGWPNAVVNGGEGIELDMQFNRLDSSAVMQKVNRSMRWNTERMHMEGDQGNDAQTIEGAYQSGRYIKDCLANKESIHNMYTLITVSAAKQQELYEKVDTLKKELSSCDLEVRECIYDMEDALRSVSPGIFVGNDIARKAKRNITMMGAAASYMMLSFELSDHNGIMIGVNDQNSTMCTFNPFLASQYPNANMILLGTTGSGKSFCLHDISLHMRMKGIPVYILTPQKGMEEFLRITNAIGGEFVHVSGSSPTHINIMDIRPVDKGDEAYLVGANVELENDSLLLAKIETLNNFIGMLVEDYDDEYEYITDKVVKAVYAKYGITEDNNSIFADEEKKTLKEMPILADLQKEYRAFSKSKVLNITESERQKAIACDKKLERYTNGPLKSLNNRTNVNLENKYIVFDFEAMKSERAVGLFIVLDFLWTKIKQDRTKNKAVFIDELWDFLSPQSEGARNKKMDKAQASLVSTFVLRLAKLVRGFGGALITATQNIGDLFKLNDGSFGSAIINNCKTKFILNIEPTEIDEMKALVKLTDNEVRKIRSSGRGHGLLIANEKKVELYTQLSEYEQDLITTDSQQLREQAERERLKIEQLKQQETQAG